MTKRASGINRLKDRQCANEPPHGDDKSNPKTGKVPVKRLQDGGGLYLEITPAGGRNWYVQYYDGRRNRAGKLKHPRIAIGKYPTVGLADARAKRDEIKRQLADGINPQAQKRIDKADVIAAWDADAPLRIIGKAWFATKFPEASTEISTFRNNWRYLNCVLNGYGGAKGLGDLPISAVTYAHIVGLLDAAQIESPHTRDRMGVTLRRIFGYACARNPTLPNPIANAKWSDAYDTPATHSHAAATEPS